MSNSAPIPVLHDETYHEKRYMDPRVDSIGDRPNLLGYLEHHGPDTDGIFTICIAGGNVTLVSKVGKACSHLSMSISQQMVCIQRNSTSPFPNNTALLLKPTAL